MRILFTCNPLFGHLNPMLPLACAAQAAGHDVVVATGADMTPLAQREGLATWPIGMTHAQAGGNTQASWLDYFEAGASRRMAPLATRCAAWRPDLVVHEETELAGPVVAATTGARALVHGLSPMPPLRLLPWFAAAIDRLAPVGASNSVLDAWRASAYLELCPRALSPVQDRIWSDVVPLRPMTPGRTEDPALARRIEQMPRAPTVFVTLGTVYSGNTAALRAAVEGVMGLGVNVIVAIGAQGDDSLMGLQGERVLVERLVPLASVLQRCTAVVSQGGSGIMLGALAQALPQLMLPQGADQFRNAELCAPTGAALALTPAAATPAAVGAAVRQLLDDGRHARAARVVADEIAAMPDAAAVIAALTANAAR